MGVESANEELEALLYDWHNGIKLHAQNRDINYYIKFIRNNNIHSVLVVGAGTGRVALPISQLVPVVALDKSRGRLKRISVNNTNLKIKHIDIVDYKGDGSTFDCVIIPYSTFQCIYPKSKIQKMLDVIYGILSKEGYLLIDVSTHFNTDIEEDWTEIAKEYCKELDSNVIELQKTLRFDSYIQLMKLFYLENLQQQYLVEERWYNYDEFFMKNILLKSNLIIESIESGYGHGKSMHRRIYKCRINR